MKLAFVLLQMTNLQLRSLLLIIAVIILVASVKIFRSVQGRKKSSRSGELHAESEITEQLDAAEDEQSVVEEVAPVVSADEYVVDENDANLFINSLYKDFTIRTTLGIHLAKSKDAMIFTTSLPWEAEANEYKSNRFKNSFLAAVPQLTNVESGGTHEVLIHKSSACKWEDLKGGILKFMFYHLHKMYAWKFEKQTIFISKVPNEEIRSFDLRIETKYHLDLGRQLFAIRGITSSSADGFPLCMDHDGKYCFSLEKARSYTWVELLPEIKKVMERYFTAGFELKEKARKYSVKDFADTDNFSDMD